MPKGQVSCSIKNCHYWSQGNICNADQIMVTSNEMANSLTDRIDAPYAAQIGATPVAKSVESCCKTFVPNNSFKALEDGVVREGK